MSEIKQTKQKIFTAYEVFLIAILAFLQFTIILDFMVLSPLSAQLLTELNVTPAKFGLVVSVYAWSAFFSGLAAAGFADKMDRKKMLLIFYTGFIAGTFLCGIAPDYNFLLMARIITGIFGGVISSITFAIVSDVFAVQVRGRVMGFVQMAFASSQVLGIPLGLYMANHIGWHSPFILIASVSSAVFITILFKMKPIDAHLKLRSDKSPFLHLWHTLSQRKYLRGFGATVLLATGGFMLMPFGSAFSVHNLGLTQEILPIVYFTTGITSMISGPVMGRYSDKIGKYRLFVIGSILTMILVLIYTNLGITPLWIVIMLNCLLFIGVTSRMVSASALMTAVPEQRDRGAFMSINASVQQFAGGIASLAAGLIVVQPDNGKLEHYPILGYVVVAAMAFTIFMMYFVNKYVQDKQIKQAVAQAEAQKTEQVEMAVV